MSLINFVFVLVLLIPIALLMWFFVNKLSDDMKNAARNSGGANSAAGKRAPERYQHSSRHFTPGYSSQPAEQASYRSPYEGRVFGSSAAEIQRREQEERELKYRVNEYNAVKAEVSKKELSKRKRRKARKNRKKEIEQRK